MPDTLQDGPGAELKTAREGMDVSTREVADALNLPLHVIEALEADDYERLPPTVFTRGYLRSYARLLELPPESLLARYPEVTEEIDAITGELPSVDAADAAPIRSLGIAAVVGVILIALLVWLLGDEEGSAPVVEPTVSGTGADAVAQPEAAVQDVTATDVVAVQPASEADASAVTEIPMVGRVAEQVPPPVEPESSTAELAKTAENAEPTKGMGSKTPVTPSVRERRITEFGDDQITFVFSEDCWVEVKSAEGENLYSDLNRTGRTLVLTGRAPFRVLLGYAPGVSLSFNGDPVALERYSRNNVANLVLGE